MGELAVMGRQGDTKIIWDSGKPDEVQAARRTFDELRKKGYLAWSVKGRDGEKDVQITEFDPHAERLIMAPPMRGGVSFEWQFFQEFWRDLFRRGGR